jgi:hypothetical protein
MKKLISCFLLLSAFALNSCGDHSKQGTTKHPDIDTTKMSPGENNGSEENPSLYNGPGNDTLLKPQSDTTSKKKKRELN